MSILAAIGRLLRSSTQLLSRLPHLPTHPPSPSHLATPNSFLRFSSAFHRTPSQPFNFSCLRPLPNRILDDPFEHIQGRIETDGPLNPVLLESLKKAARTPTEAEALAFLDVSGIEPNKELINSVIWEFKEDWRLAVLGFKWGVKRGCIDEKAREFTIWVLGTHGKFNTAWVLIRDWHRSSINTRPAMLVMIDRYAAANNPGKAIWTFNFLEKFRLSPDEEAYSFLLTALCKHGNIEEAEEFMLANKKLFPLEAVGFNIILNGWCNIWVDVLEAKRIWREMSKYCIIPDAASYTHMISCFSRVGNLFDSLRLYDEMRKRGFVPGLEVYNSLIYVLTRENCFNKALQIIEKIKEAGFNPNSNTYNSMIWPLCEAQKVDEASNVLATMLEENLSPTVETFHALIDGTGFEGTLEILKQMRLACLGPSSDTFVLLLSKCFRLEKPEEALRFWAEMKIYEVVPDMAHYYVMVEGLANSGLLNEARKYYAEMRSNGFSDKPKLEMLLMQLAPYKNEKTQRCGEMSKKDKCSINKGRNYGSKEKCRTPKRGTKQHGLNNAQ